MQWIKIQQRLWVDIGFSSIRKKRRILLPIPNVGSNLEFSSPCKNSQICTAMLFGYQATARRQIRIKSIVKKSGRGRTKTSRYLDFLFLLRGLLVGRQGYMWNTPAMKSLILNFWCGLIWPQTYMAHDATHPSKLS